MKVKSMYSLYLTALYSLFHHSFFKYFFSFSSGCSFYFFSWWEFYNVIALYWITSYHTKTLERMSSYFPMPFSNVCFALVTISLLLYTWISLILLWIFFLLFLCYSTVLKHMGFKHNFIFRILILEPFFLFKQLVHSA